MKPVQFEKLSRRDRALRDSCIARVNQGVGGLVDAAEALADLRDARLYRETHKTFSAFCRDTFGLTYQRINQKIQAAEVMRTLDSTENDKAALSFLPANESQVTELASLPEGRLVEGWQKSVKNAGGKQPTHKQIRKVVGEMLGRKSLAETNPDKHNADTLRRCIYYLKSILKPSKNINAALEYLTKEIESGATKSSKGIKNNEI